jgi:general stress protein 26
MTLGANSVSSNTWLQIEGTAQVTTAEDERRSFWFAALEQYFQSIEDPRYSIVIVKPTKIQLSSFGVPPEVWQPD